MSSTNTICSHNVVETLRSNYPIEKWTNAKTWFSFWFKFLQCQRYKT